MRPCTTTTRSSATLFWAIAASFCFASAASPAQESACTPSRGSQASVIAVGERAELRLADGRTVKLADIDVPRATQAHPELADLPRTVLRAWLAGRPVTVQPLAAAPDRWGRTVADIFAPADFAAPDEAPVSAAWMLVDAGLARARPTANRGGCTTALIAAEATARAGKLGLWAAPGYAVLDAGDETALAVESGRFVVVEGDIARVGNGTRRTFLDFGRRRGSFTALVSKRALKLLDAAGLSPKSLDGSRLRVRGVLDTRFGPRIEVAGPQDIERP